jgi:hypothetical protein
MKSTANVFNIILPPLPSRKATVALALLALSTLNPQLSTVLAQGTAFTYQGRLNDGGNPATGLYDLSFTAYDAVTNGTAVSGVVTNAATPVSNGLFAVTLDFGAGVFTGPPRWLDLAVRTNGGGAFTTLSPRQLLTPAPYALMANSASNLLGTLSAAKLAGTVANSQLANNSVTVNPGTGLSGGGPVPLGGSTTLANAGVLSVTGNSDITATTVNGAVTLGDTATSLNTASRIVKRDASGNFSAGSLTLSGNLNLPYTTASSGIINFGAYRIIHYYLGNFFAGNTAGNFTMGGGGDVGIGDSVLYNDTIGSCDTGVGGLALYANTTGSYNTANGYQALLANTSGSNNVGLGYQAGYNLTTGSYNIDIGSLGVAGESSTIRLGTAGTQTNTFIAGIYGASPSGGAAVFVNPAGQLGTAGTVSLAQLPAGVLTNSQSGVVLTGAFSGDGAGLTNINLAGLTIQQNDLGAPNVIAGSPVNFVTGGVVGATIGGGGATDYHGSPYTNSVTADFGTVGGGEQNTASGYEATVGGGEFNAASGIDATVGGGEFNAASGIDATVAGGGANLAGEDDATVGGGGENRASGYASTVAGGYYNTASQDDATVAGGYFNTASGYEATVGGGWSNLATNDAATVPGGSNNLAGGVYSFAAGQSAKALHDGSFVWADAQDPPFASTTNNQFSVRASGGVRLVTGGAGLSVDGAPVLTNGPAGVTLTGAFSGDGTGLSNLNAAALTGTVPQAQLPATVVTNNESGVTLNGTFSGAFSGDGSGLTNLTAAQFNAWLLTGNAGTICGPNFLGTTDNQPLELAVNSLPVLWLGPNLTSVGNGGNTVFRQDNGNTILPLPPTTTSAYCIISGGQNNTLGNSVLRGTISGGGGNSILDNASESTIGGGAANTIVSGANDATISGGSQNTNSGNYATLGGGQFNAIQPNAPWSTIGGGEWNTIQGSAQAGTIAGGYDNFIPASGTYATIGGGCSNIASGVGSFVGGGGYDGTTIIGNIASSPASMIGGGRGNVIQVLSSYSFIGGGDTNDIQSYSPCSVIGGGHNNIIQTNSPASTIGGGSNNTIQVNSPRCFIGGGCNNTLQTNSFVSVIGGGSNNTIQANSLLSFIGGGSQNTLLLFVTNSIIGGGYQNVIQAYNSYSTIAGGEGNTIQPGLNHATIGGGEQNIVSANIGTIPGGHHAAAANYAQMAYASGLFANPGDSQYSLYVLRGTYSVYPGKLYLDGGAIGGTSEIVLPGNRSCSFTARIVGRDSTAAGNTCAFNLRGGATRNSTGFVTVQVPWNEKLMDTFTGSPCSALVTSTGAGDGKLRVQVNGLSGVSVRWVATVETTEVANP